MLIFSVGVRAMYVCTSEYSGATVEVIDISVMQGVSIRVAFEHTVALHHDVFDALEDLMVGDVLELPIVNELRHTLSRKHHVARIPSEFVSPWVVIRFRGHEASREGLKGVQFPSSLADALQHSRDGHVIDSRIDSAFHHDEDVVLFCLCI